MIVLRSESVSVLLREATRTGQLVLSRDGRFDGMKVFCSEADAIAWIEAHPELELVDITVAQDGGWLSIVISYYQGVAS